MICFLLYAIDFLSKYVWVISSKDKRGFTIKKRLNFKHLKETLLKVKSIQNNRSLCYLEGELQQPILSPTMLINDTNIAI